jgi:hypothetical protein
MTGAPVMSGTAGALIGVLDACLINGFGSVVASSLVVVSGVATLTVSAGHGLVNPGAASSVDVGIVAVVSGVTGALSALNKEWRVTVSSTTVLTWECGVAIPDGSAAGTISVKHAPAGWTKAFSGTNLAAYKSSDITATGCYLRVDDTPAQYPTLVMYEAMTGINSGTGPAPTTGSLFFGKSDTANASARPWRVCSDSKMFFIFCKLDNVNWSPNISFGDFLSYKPGDAFNCMLIAQATTTGYGNLFSLSNNNAGSFISRSYTQIGGAVASGRYSHGSCANIGNGVIVSLNLVDNSVCSWPVECWEGLMSRGLVPGLYSPMHVNYPPDGNVYLSSQGKALFTQILLNATYRAMIDVTGPWR